MTDVLDGKKLSSEIRDIVAQKTLDLEATGITPCLGIVVATEDAGTDHYVRHISKAADTAGILTIVRRLGSQTTEAEIGDEITKLVNDSTVHGIILQTPLPAGVHADNLRSLIPPAKDIDGANPLSAGRLMSGVPAFAPSTARAVMELLKYHEIPIASKHVVVIGRSLVVGKPLAHLLLAADATVTICHSKTEDLAQISSQADILVVAIGRPLMIGADYVKQGAIVVDVGTNVNDEGRLVGDVKTSELDAVASAVSPVPGGVGPITTSVLLEQTVQAARSTS